MYPVVAFGSSYGVVSLLSVYDASLPQFLTEFHLSSFSILNVRFVLTGKAIIAMDESNDIFVIRVSQQFQ